MPQYCTKLGLHVDADEAACDVPVVSLSLGASARFRIGGRHRDDSTRVIVLNPGDVLVLGGEARHCYHGVDSVAGPRINLTMRRVSVPRT